MVDGNRWFNVYTGEFLKNTAEIGNLVVAVEKDRPVYLRDIATIREGESESKSIVDNSLRARRGAFATAPAVTVAVAKKHGTNGVDVADSILEEAEGDAGDADPART